MKLYCPRTLEDELIGESLLAIAENLVSAGWAESWFFIRYSDPDPHVRLRFRGTPDKLTRKVFPELCSWTQGLMSDGVCLKVSFDTYEREMERFGGREGIVEAESLFCADSRFVAKVLRFLRNKSWTDKTALLALTVDTLLSGLGMTPKARLLWYQSKTNARSAHVGEDYRRRKKELRSAVGGGESGDGSPSGDRLSGILMERRASLSRIGERFLDLERAELLTQSFEGLLSSFVHLHINRISASYDSISETHLLSLLVRTLEGLKWHGQASYRRSD